MTLRHWDMKYLKLGLIRGLFAAVFTAAFCPSSALANGQEWMGGEELFDSRANLSVEHFPLRRGAATDVQQLFQSVDLSKINISGDQPQIRIRRGVGVEESYDPMNIQVKPTGHPSFSVPVRSNVWQNIQQWNANPDAVLRSGTIWGGSGGGAGMLCAPANPQTRKPRLRDLFRELGFDFSQALRPTPLISGEIDYTGGDMRVVSRTKRHVEYYDYYPFKALFPFRFQPGEPLKASMMEVVESQIWRRPTKRSLEEIWKGKSEQQIYRELSDWVQHAAPAFYYRWQLLKPHIVWKPVEQIELVPDSLFGGYGNYFFKRQWKQKDRRSIDRHIRIKNADGSFSDCKKYQVLLNQFEPTPRGEIPRVTIFYNERFFDEYFSPLSRAIARIHEEWYVMANLQGQVSSDQVRERVIGVSATVDAYNNRSPNSWIFYSDLSQMSLRNIVYPVKRLFSRHILKDRLTDVTRPHFYTQTSVEIALRSENGLRSVLEQISDEYDPSEVPWRMNLSTRENQFNASSFVFREKYMIQQAAKGLLFNSQKMINFLNSPEKAMVFLIDAYELTRGESRKDRRFENERLLNSPRDQQQWTLEQIVSFNTFCGHIEKNDQRLRDNYLTLNDRTYGFLVDKTRQWCREVLPQLQVQL